VLDPFAGVGTSLAESMLSGHRALGFEINPYAALATRVKLQANTIDLNELNGTISRFCDWYASNDNPEYISTTTAPAGFKGRAEFYAPAVLKKVLIVQDYISLLPTGPMQDLFRLSFAATMVRYSNYSYEPSLGRRVSAGREEIHDFPVGDTILSKLREMAKDIEWMQSRLGTADTGSSVIHDSFFNVEQHLVPAQVDLVITSPPYLNNYHYNRNTRPHLYWLGYAAKPGDFSALEQANFGKYWQTVREMKCLDLEFALPDSNLTDRIATLRTIKPEKGIYGGNGWANYAAAYFNDCLKFAKALHYVMKPDATALVVIGNSILQGIMIPTDQYFAQIAQTVGLDLIEIHIPRATRVGNSIIQSDVRVVAAEDKHKLYEAVIELRRR
jgi:DNA modification methylase